MKIIQCIICFANLLLLTSSNSIDDFDDDFSSKIVGGTPANLSEIHYQVTLQKNPYTNTSAFCGGVLISLRTVLTAARCVHNLNTGDFRVVAGVTSLNDTEIELYGQTAFVTKIVVHKYYKPEKNNDDIALLILSSSFQPGPYLRQITWRLGSTMMGQICVISGFGSLFTNGPPSNVLRRATVRVGNQTICRSNYGGDKVVTYDMICAGDGLTDFCLGDYGGPLVCAGLLVGIASFGRDCGVSVYPGVYTDLSHYTHWITENDSFVAKGSMSVVLAACLLIFMQLKMYK